MPPYAALAISCGFLYSATGNDLSGLQQAIVGHRSTTVIQDLSLKEMSQPAMDPPPGVEADLENPEDVLWTINLVTQALTLAICSFFVLTRVLQRFRIPGWLLSVDECMLIASLLLDGSC